MARHLAEAWAALPAALRERWQVVAVPRHAAAAAELRREAREVDGGGAGSANQAWRWDERAGVLAGYYAAAEVAFVGGTLAPYGGHNPLEPAATITAYIVQVALGDLPHGSIGYQTIFAAGLTLALMTLFFNVLGHLLRKRYRQAY